MKRINQTLFIFALTAILSACGSTPFNYEYGYQPDNFEELKTYRWAKDKTRRAIPEIANQLVASADEVMNKKGFKLKKTGEVDFILSYDITAQPQIDVNSHKIYGGVGLGFSWRRNEGVTKDPLKVAGKGHVTKIVGKGTIIIDASHPVTNQVFWRGIASKELNMEARSDIAEPAVNVVKAKKQTDKATKEMLSHFPPDF